MMEESKPISSAALWSPIFVAVATFFFVPGGWLLGILNFRRMGMKDKAREHVYVAIGATVLIVVVALLGMEIPAIVRFIFLGFAAWYMHSANSGLIKQYQEAGGLVSQANILLGIVIAIAAGVAWYLVVFGIISLFVW
jgi:hypothetical protein